MLNIHPEPPESSPMGRCKGLYIYITSMEMQNKMYICIHFYIICSRDPLEKRDEK
ncbi:hypothetical protein ACE6H2_024141 [Prunus campanulata]